MARIKKPLKAIPRPNQQQVKEALEAGGPYIFKGMLLEDELQKTGWNPDGVKEVKEPVWPGNLQGLPTQTLKDLYDSYIAWHSYLSNEVTRINTKIRVSKERAKAVEAECSLQSNLYSELTNAEMRKSWVTTHPAYVQARSDYIFFAQDIEVQETRLSNCKKYLSRISKELWDRTQNKDSMPNFDGADAIEEAANRVKMKHVFRQVQEADGLS